MNMLPEKAFLRIFQIIGNSRAKPPIPALIPVGRSTWLAGVKSGRYPSPIKLSPRCTAWCAEDIYKLIEQLNKKEKAME